MRAQIRGLNMASKNAQDGISLIQTAEGALNEVHSMLQRMSELAVQASNDTNTDEDRQALQKEIAQIISEVDKVADTTEFNTMKLLDGTFANQANNGGGGTTNTNPFITITHNAVDATPKPMYPSTDPSGRDYSKLKTILDKEIVPQSVQSILDSFNDTFGYLDGSNIGIGLQLTDNPSSSVLASVSMRSMADSAPIPDVDLSYKLTINVAFLSFNPDNTLTDASRRNLESTIVHEMMHAFMDESLTAGMAGVNQQLQYTQAFPEWFIEGTAQVAGGGTDYVERGLGIDTTTSVDQIRNTLGGRDRLGTNTTVSKYATGYLATLYLGHLASGGATDANGIASGIDAIMNDVRGGKSLSDAIKERTNNKYTSIADFESKFATDGAAFTKQFMIDSGMGRGALVTGDLTEDDLLPDVALPNITLFDLAPDHSEVWNYYPQDYPVISGGQANSAGVAGPDHQASAVTPPGNNNQGTQGGTQTGGQTGGTTQPGGTGGNGNNQGQGGTGTNPTPPGGNGGTGNQGTQGGQGTQPTQPTTPKGAMTFHVGANGNQVVHLNIEAMSSASLGIDKVNLSTQQGANDAITIAHKAIDKVSAQRSQLGAIQNRLEHTINNLSNTAENLTSAESRIRDADMAGEMMKFTKNSILVQAAQAMLAQANTHPQSVLNLIA